MDDESTPGETDSSFVLGQVDSDPERYSTLSDEKFDGYSAGESRRKAKRRRSRENAKGDDGGMCRRDTAPISGSETVENRQTLWLELV